MIELSYHPDWRWLAAAGLAVVAVVFWSYHRAINRPKGLTRIVLLALRLLVILLVAGCLLDPHWVKRIEHRQPMRIAVLLDTSRSMGIKDVADNRLTAAKSWLQEKLLPAAPAEAAVSIFAFDQSVVRLSSNGLPRQEFFASVLPAGNATGLGDALETILAAAGTEPLQSVLLCSDGIETTHRDPVSVARLYRRKGIPIQTVTFGTTNEMQDLIMENVQVRRAVPNQSTSKVRVTFRSVGFENISLPIELRHQDEVVARTTVKLTGGRQQVELEFTPRLKGYQIFEAAIPVLAGEWLSDNNRQAFGLEVVDPTIRVIYMEGSPTQARQPEWKYLKDALQSDPNIRVKTLFRPQFLGDQSFNTIDSDFQTGEKIYHVQHPTEGYPRTLAELLQYDVVINSDIYKEAFTQEQLNNTAKLVEEFGGGFVMIGGNTAFGAGGYQQTVLDRFIPVAMESGEDTMYAPFQMAIPPGVLSHPLMAIGATVEETKAIWTEKFPRLYGYNRVGRAKPGAVVLGVDPTQRAAWGPRIILAAQEIGRGRTLAFTSDTTRQWGTDFETIWGERINSDQGIPLTSVNPKATSRQGINIRGGTLNELNCDSRYYRRFWINAIRWLAAGKIASSNAPVTLELAQTVARSGEPVPATVRVLARNGVENGEAQVQVMLTAPNRVVPPLTATYDPVTRLYHERLLPPFPGDFTATATAMVKGSQVGADKQLLVCHDADVELEKVQARPNVMAQIAHVSGGTALDPRADSSDRLTSVFGKPPPVTVELRRRPLWDEWPWLLTLTGLLTLEWILRRLRGMA
jgi:uncharacterized membrane protein